jgi:hypothetical protein
MLTATAPCPSASGRRIFVLCGICVYPVFISHTYCTPIPTPTARTSASSMAPVVCSCTPSARQDDEDDKYDEGDLEATAHAHRLGADESADEPSSLKLKLQRAVKVSTACFGAAHLHRRQA